MCLRIRRGRSLLSVLGKPHVYLSSLRIGQTKIETCFVPEHVLTHFILRLPTHLPLNKSEVLTGRPFSGQIADSCWNKHAAEKVSNIYLKSKTECRGCNVFAPLSSISIHALSCCHSLHCSSSLSSQLLNHWDCRLPGSYPPPPSSLCDVPLSILFCWRPCGFHIRAD